MTQPPRLAESFLASLGAQPEFRDAVLGDLAEELNLRAAWDGVRAARRWYYREAMRAVPHLLRDWARGLRVRDVTRLIGVAITSFTFMAIIGVTVLVVARVTLGALGLSSGLDWLGQHEPISVIANMTIGSVGAALGGYIAGWLHPRAPIVGALALGVAWAAAGVAAVALVTTTLNPLLYLMPLMVIPGTIAGGALRARVRPDEESQLSR